jgi:hypothetical protein
VAPRRRGSFGRDGRLVGSLGLLRQPSLVTAVAARAEGTGHEAGDEKVKPKAQTRACLLERASHVT